MPAASRNIYVPSAVRGALPDVLRTAQWCPWYNADVIARAVLENGHLSL
jgi:hypothetical protein